MNFVIIFPCGYEKKTVSRLKPDAMTDAVSCGKTD